MSSQDEESSGIWPAYVAAMACLMQALLLLMAVIAIANFLSGQAASLAKAAGQRVHLGAGDDGEDEGGRLLGRANRGGSKANAAASAVERPNTAALTRDGVTTAHGHAGLRFTFAPEAFRLEDTQAARLRSFVTSQGARADAPGRWRVWATVDTRDVQARRGAYLRLMSARSWLLEAGVAATAIDLQLFSDPEAGSDAERMVYLEAR